MTRDVFETILREQRHRVFTHALGCLRDRDDAEDVTQETFLRLWRAGGDVPADRAGAWLLRVAHNLCIDHTRRRRTWRAYLGRPDPDALERLVGDSRPEPGDQGLGDELHAALATLPAETRSMVLMHYQQGLKLREIAALLDVGLGTLKVRIHRARKTLRAALETGGTPLVAREENGS
jgi:RNA polymerase sigma-70 factor (ECF subfamily)